MRSLTAQQAASDSPPACALAILCCIWFHSIQVSPTADALLRYIGTLAPAITSKILSLLPDREDCITDAMLRSCAQFLITAHLAHRQFGEHPRGDGVRLAWRIYANHDAAGGSDGVEEAAMAIALSDLPVEGPSAVRSDQRDFYERIVSNASRVLGHVLQIDQATRRSAFAAVVAGPSSRRRSDRGNRIIAAFKACILAMHNASHLLRDAKVCVDLVRIWHALRSEDAAWLRGTPAPAPLMVSLYACDVVEQAVLAEMLDAGLLELVICETTAKPFFGRRKERARGAPSAQLTGTVRYHGADYRNAVAGMIGAMVRHKLQLPRLQAVAPFTLRRLDALCDAGVADAEDIRGVWRECFGAAAVDLDAACALAGCGASGKDRQRMACARCSTPYCSRSDQVRPSAPRSEPR